MATADWVPLAVAVVTGVGAPTILAWQINNAATKSKIAENIRADEIKKADNERADLLAQRVSDSADKAAAQASEAARLLLVSNERVAETAKASNARLDVIHTLVNSTLTAAKQGQLDEMRRSLAALKEIVELRTAAGQSPSTVALATIDITEQRIGALELELAERERQGAVAASQMNVVVAADEKVEELKPNPADAPEAVAARKPERAE